MHLILYARKKGKIIVLSQISPLSDLRVWFWMPNLFHQPSPTPAWNSRLDALHAQSPSQPTQNLDLHSFSVQHKSEQPLAMQMHSHLFLPLRCYQFIFWTMARGRLFPWREFSWMIQKASFLTQLSPICSATPACLDPRRKPQTQVRSVQPLHIRKVWCGLLTPHRELTWGGLTDCGSEMLCFATFATILCKTRHLDLALGWQLLWNEFTTPNFKCLSHSFGDWLTNSSSGRQMDEDGCSSFWSELTSPQLLGGAPAPTLEYWVFGKSCQAQCKSMSHPLPVSLLLLR